LGFGKGFLAALQVCRVFKEVLSKSLPGNAVKDSLNNNFPKFAFFIVPALCARCYTQVPQSASIGVQSLL
jgi:hypothetical protein